MSSTALKKSSKLARGFSLIEIMITMAIVAGILIGIALYVQGQRKKAAEQEARNTITILATEVSGWKLSHRRLPTNEEGLKVLLPLDADEKDKAHIIDPWGNPYQYKTPGDDNRDFDIWSMGPKNSSETIIGSWQQ